MSLYGNFWCDSVQAPLILIATLSCACQCQHFRQIGPRRGRCRRLERLLQPEVIDHQLRVSGFAPQLPGLFEAPPAQQVDRQRMPRPRRPGPG